MGSGHKTRDLLELHIVSNLMRKHLLMFRQNALLYSETSLLENVEHCGGEPEQADTACLLANRNAWVPGDRPLCPLCSLSPGTGVPREGLFVYMLSVSWRASRGRHELSF